MSRQELELAALRRLNRQHLARRSGHALAEARIKSFETAFGMQMAAPEAFDLSGESDATHDLYGLERGSTEGFAWQCLAARRLVCLLYTSPSPRDVEESRMPSSA